MRFAAAILTIPDNIHGCHLRNVFGAYCRVNNLLLRYLPELYQSNREWKASNHDESFYGMY